MCVEKRSDDLWLGVKRQTNLAIASSPRNIFRYSLGLRWLATDGASAPSRICEVEILEKDEGRKPTYFYQTPNAQIFDRESVLRGNLVVREGNNPDHRIRSLIFA